jgi:hypothetical protein
VHNCAQLDANLQEVFQAYPNATYERSYGKLLDVYRATMKSLGGNTYVIPHSDIRNRQICGSQALDYEVDAATVQLAWAAYQQEQQNEVPNQIIVLNNDE